MTRSQASILESIAALPDEERRALVLHLVAANLDSPSFFSRMTPADRARLDEGMEQARRGEIVDAASVWDRLSNRRAP